MIEREQRGGVTVLRLNHGKVSALDAELCDALSRELDGLADAEAVVLTGTGRVFSAGVDLFRLLDGGAEYLAAFFPALTHMLTALFRFPRPVVAAVNGHAIAGGCVLACACDRRLMAAGRIGVTETLVGVPYPTIALEIMRFAAGRRLSELVYGGATFEPDAALATGLVDEVVAPEALLERACEDAARYGALGRDAFAICKREIRKPYLARCSADVDREVQRVWASDAARERIRAYLERTLSR
jgi:enoyl-CoA hydratase